jgi:uncharacterized membrane protein ArfC
VNWWLMAVAFALGLVLTGWFMIGKVTREIPVQATAVPPKVVVPEVVEPKVERRVESRVEPKDDALKAYATGPHGPGSAEPGKDGSGPHGWMVKGNLESKLYHSPESPSFGVTRAEVWFRDVGTAEAAGFNRWDSGKSQRGRLVT